jgi:plasmid stabilization system protein ParE
LTPTPPVIFTPAARWELIEAHNWYENKSPGLGRRFMAAVDAEVERVGANPLEFPAVYRTIRRALLRRFPYALMYVVESDNRVTVIACFHGSRDPVHWQRRM